MRERWLLPFREQGKALLFCALLSPLSCAEHRAAGTSNAAGSVASAGAAHGEELAEGGAQSGGSAGATSSNGGNAQSGAEAGAGAGAGGSAGQDGGLEEAPNSCPEEPGPLLPLDDQDQSVRVFIAAGQSNMVGSDSSATQIDGFPAYVGVGTAQDNVRFSYLLEREQTASLGWLPLAPVGDGFGPELTFARKVTRFVQAPIAIIKSAVGGTTLWQDWAPSAPAEGLGLYAQTLALINDSLQTLDEQQIPYRLEGVLWHQGENDMLDGTHVGEYEANLTAFIASLRTDLGQPELPFFIGEVSTKGVWAYDFRQNMKQLREQQQRVVAADPTLHWVPTSHVGFLTSGTGPHYHFGTLGQLGHGEQYADAYLRTLGADPSPPATPYCPGPALGAEENIQLFILFGQRSMDGEAAWVDSLAALPAYAALAEPQPAIPYQFFLGGGVQQSSDWTPLGPAQFQGWFGPELTLGPTLAAALGANVALIKVADGGSAMPDWSQEPTQDAMRPIYAKAIAFVKQALGQLTSRGISYELKGAFWAHGELDSWGAGFLPDQSAALQALMANVRDDLDAPELPWFIAGVSEQLAWSGAVPAFNEMLESVATQDGNAHFVNTQDLPFGVVSFETEGTLALGERFASAYLEAP